MKSLVYALVGCWVAVRQAIKYWWDRDYRPLFRTAYELGRDALETETERWRRYERIKWLAEGKDAQEFDRLADLTLDMYQYYHEEPIAWWWWSVRNQHQAGKTFDQIKSYLERIF